MLATSPHAINIDPMSRPTRKTLRRIGRSLAVPSAMERQSYGHYKNALGRQAAFTEGWVARHGRPISASAIVVGVAAHVV